MELMGHDSFVAVPLLVWMYADASVFIELHGTEGHVGWQLLEARSSDFSRGGVDEFNIKGSAIGKLDTVGIKHDNKGFGAAWHLQQVCVCVCVWVCVCASGCAPARARARVT